MKFQKQGNKHSDAENFILTSTYDMTRGGTILAFKLYVAPWHQGFYDGLEVIGVKCL